MTRLIDGDALEKAIYEWMPKDQETWMDSKIPPIENLVVSIMMTIQEQQPVDAIPIEFIQKRIDFLHDLAEYDFEAREYELEKLIDDWKKEQEKQNDQTD